MCSSCSLTVRGPSVWETAGEPLHPGKKSYPLRGGKGKPVGNTVQSQSLLGGAGGRGCRHCIKSMLGNV